MIIGVIFKTGALFTEAWYQTKSNYDEPILSFQKVVFRRFSIMPPLAAYSTVAHRMCLAAKRVNSQRLLHNENVEYCVIPILLADDDGIYSIPPRLELMNWFAGDQGIASSLEMALSGSFQLCTKSMAEEAP